MQPGQDAGMAAMSSLEAVRRKIRSLQEQADAAEERAGRLQREVDQERGLREEVGPLARPGPARLGSGAAARWERAGALDVGPGARLTLAAPRPAGQAAASFAAVSDKMVTCLLRQCRPPCAAGGGRCSRRAGPGPQVRSGVTAAFGLERCTLQLCNPSGAWGR